MSGINKYWLKTIDSTNISAYLLTSKSIVGPINFHLVSYSLLGGLFSSYRPFFWHNVHYVHKTEHFTVKSLTSVATTQLFKRAYKFCHSRSQQKTDQRVLVLTLKFLALKKTGFSPVKNTSQNFIDLFYLYSMQLFRADTTIFPKEN